MKEQIADAKRRMEGAVRALSSEFATVRTGRASTHLLDRVQVEAYGSRMPLSQLATLHAPEPRLLTIQPYDKSLFKAIERAIQESDVGLTPSSDGQVIRLAIPQLTEERRKELVRLVHKMAEEARVAIRNVRRDVLNELKRAEKDGDISRDQLARAQEEIQRLTDAEIKAVDEMMAVKEAEIREV